MNKVLAKSFQALKKSLKKNSAFMKLYNALSYDEENVKIFSSLYEHERMLADKVRLDAYSRAIKKYVKEGDTVVELGTGTGILSFFASKKKPAKIYAIDHSKIIDVAKSISQQNRLDNIEFVNMNSRQFSMSGKADVIIQEQIGDYLFEENMISNVLDLRDRLLSNSGRILPSQFELFIAPVKVRDSYNVPFIWEQAIEGIDYSFLKDQYEGEMGRHYYYRSISPFEVEYMLCEDQEESVFSFDLMTMSEDAYPRNIRTAQTATRDGRLDGFIIYFNVIFDDEISFNNSPLGTNTSWVGRLFRVESQQCSKGDTIDFELIIDDIQEPTTWNWTSSVSDQNIEFKTQ